MKVALLGYGTVGRGVDAILAKQENIDVKYIYVRKNKLDEDKRKVCDYDIILNDPEVEVIIEVMGGIETPHQMICEAFKNHKSVVSASKAVIAQYFKEFHQLAKENNVSFKFEASCGGMIPVIQSIENIKQIEKITSLEGILNGTSNYIIDKMERENFDFDVALKAAQEAGYAEADPSSDIDGIDTMNKLYILSSLANDLEFDLNEIPHFGIRNLKKIDLDFFKARKQTIRLIGSFNYENEFTAAVEPVIFSENELFAHVLVNYNLIKLESVNAGPLSLHGQGAGMLPTAHAIVEDLNNLHRTSSYQPSKKVKVSSNSVADYYVRYNDQQVIWEKLSANAFKAQFAEIIKQDAAAFYARFN